MYIACLVLCFLTPLAYGQPGKCDQTPPRANVLTPTPNNGTDRNPFFKLSVVTQEPNVYLPAQTYVVVLEALNNSNKTFKWFMITAEDPAVDESEDNFDHRISNVGTLKPLDSDRKTRFSERCFSSVENADNTLKDRITVHWLSPPRTSAKQMVRLRAMVAENEDVWYEGDDLTVVLEQNDKKAQDSPPLDVIENCRLCSEARYEITFTGHWSRMAHPRHYPTKPDDNGYSHMIGASHANEFVLWEQGSPASEALKVLAEKSDTTLMERQIISEVLKESGTRTMIRGKRRHHPHMSEPSSSLLRADRFHHLFSIVVAMRPSPDWFLGVSKFELCNVTEWLNEASLPLFPWDAGTMDGVSYESVPSVTNPVDNVERVAVGSFDPQSPFYQKNLNDLKPFAYLSVKLLDVFPLEGVDCHLEELEQEEEEEEPQMEMLEELSDPEPKVLESIHSGGCYLSEWEDWSPCVPEEGNCGIGKQTRQRSKMPNIYFESYMEDNVQQPTPEPVACAQDARLTQTQHCFVDCY